MNTTTPSLILRKLNEYAKTYEYILDCKPTIFDKSLSRKEVLLLLSKMLFDDALLMRAVKKVNVDIIGLGKYDFKPISCERAYDGKTLDFIDIYLLSNENKAVTVNLYEFSNLFITYIEPDLRTENETWQVSISLERGGQVFTTIELIF